MKRVIIDRSKIFEDGKSVFVFTPYVYIYNEWFPLSTHYDEISAIEEVNRYTNKYRNTNKYRKEQEKGMVDNEEIRVLRKQGYKRYLRTSYQRWNGLYLYQE